MLSKYHKTLQRARLDLIPALQTIISKESTKADNDTMIADSINKLNKKKKDKSKRGSSYFIKK